jgi:glutaredoxin
MSVTVFSKHNCKYCKDAKALLETKINLQVKYIYLDEQINYEQAREEMIKLMGLSIEDPRPTLPQIFFGSKFIPGGASGLRKLEEDQQLNDMLKDIHEVTSFPPSPALGTWNWKVETYDANDF